MRPTQLAREAREVVTEMTGLEAERVTGLRRNGEGWIVTVEVLELSRVPDTMDVLGLFEVVLGDDGDLVSFTRRRRYARGSTEREE